MPDTRLWRGLDIMETPCDRCLEMVGAREVAFHCYRPYRSKTDGRTGVKSDGCVGCRLINKKCTRTCFPQLRWATRLLCDKITDFRDHDDQIASALDKMQVAIDEARQSLLDGKYKPKVPLDLPQESRRRHKVIVSDDEVSKGDDVIEID